MKSTHHQWIIPLAGLLTLTACNTTPPAHSPSEAAAPPSATGTSSTYLLTLVKHAPGLVSVGDQFDYELTVTAKEDVAAATVTDTLPDGASFVSADPVAVQNGNQLTWKLGDLNQTESKLIKVTLKADKEGELTGCTTFSAIPRVCVKTTVGRPQLTIEKTGPELAVLGKEVSYNIVVHNTGNTTAKDVVVTDTLPEGLSSAGGQRELTFNVGDLEPGASKSIPVPLVADKRGKVANKAAVTASHGGRVEAEATTTIVQAGVKIEKSTNDKELFINRTARYELVVSNTGDTDLSDVVLTDTAAAETVIAAADGASVSGTTATWNVGELKAGDKKSFSIKVLSKVPGRFADTATVTTAQGLKDSAQSFTQWKGVTGMLVEMLDDPDPIQVGETSQYTVRVTNQGASIDIEGMRIVATLPDELELVPGTVSDEGVVSGKTITWPMIPSVGPKASVVRTYLAKGIKAGDARSSVSVTSSQRPQPIEQHESTTVY
jgi:uncharacterized repeat protein (TIGR01451 family)/fimbrial isopeptide formation D2 family protein